MQQQQQRLYVLRYHLCVSSAANVGGLGLAGGGGQGVHAACKPVGMYMGSQLGGGVQFSRAGAVPQHRAGSRKSVG